MPKRITVLLDDEAGALLPRLAGGARKQGDYLGRLIRAAAAQAPEAAAESGEFETLRMQVRGIMSELQSLNARLVTLETRDE